MLKSLFPFGLFPAGLAPGWLVPDGGGYNFYRGVGGSGSVDFAAVVGHAQPNQAAFSLVAAGHAPSTRYTYVLRPVRGNAQLETPDYSCSVEFETDGEGEWVGLRPAAVDQPQARVLSGGRIELRWGYATPPEASPPEDFGVRFGSGPAETASASPQALEPYDGDGEYTKALALVGGRTYYFTVVARSAGGVESRPSRVIGPYVADDDAPAAPKVYVAAVF